jgi:hypothetical protein
MEQGHTCKSVPSSGAADPISVHPKDFTDEQLERVHRPLGIVHDSH